MQLGTNFFLELILQLLEEWYIVLITGIRPSTKPMGALVFARPLATLNLIKLLES